MPEVEPASSTVLPFGSNVHDGLTGEEARWSNIVLLLGKQSTMATDALLQDGLVDGDFFHCLVGVLLLCVRRRHGYFHGNTSRNKQLKTQ